MEPNSGPADELLDRLENVEAKIDTPEIEAELEESIKLAQTLRGPNVFGRVVSGFDRSDFAEALVGSLVFGIPLILEGGTYEVGDYLAQHPRLLLITNISTLGVIGGLLYVADIQNVEIRNPILGIIPRKLVGTVGTATFAAAVLLTGWGRIEWARPFDAYAVISVAVLFMAMGAVLGDILPGD